MNEKIYIIGTLHQGFTPKDELADTLARLEPDLLMVELPPADSPVREQAEQISDEMKFAFDWAHKHSIPVVCFDTNEGILKVGIDENDPEYIALSDKEKKEAEKHSWKYHNKLVLSGDSEVLVSWRAFRGKYIDEEKGNRREEQMLENIRAEIANGMTHVVLTGVGHLLFFERQMPDAEFPLRDGHL